MNNIFLVSENHPLFEVVKRTFDNVMEIDPTQIYVLDATDFDEVDYIFDFTCFDRDTKSDLLDRIFDISECLVFSDMTINWADYLLKEYPMLAGAFAAAFYSPKNAIEVFSRSSEDLSIFNDVLKRLNLEAVNCSYPGVAFTYPRVISMIINEAYFAKEENLATDEDIDTAMKFGVNYPLGPFEWVQRIGSDKVILVLDELYAVTGDPRYRCSKLLRMEM